MSAPRLPEVIRVQRRGDAFTMTIDGEEFPYPVDASGVSTHVTDGDIPSVTLTLPAHTVEVVDSAAPPAAPPAGVDAKAAARGYLESLSPDRTRRHA